MPPDRLGGVARDVVRQSDRDHGHQDRQSGRATKFLACSPHVERPSRIGGGRLPELLPYVSARNLLGEIQKSAGASNQPCLGCEPSGTPQHGCCSDN